MKNFLKKLVLFILKLMAKSRIRRFKGKIIAVTGSIGKTSTKEAIYSVLNTQFKVKKSNKSMNTDFGLLLSILDVESGYTSVTKWSWFLLKAFYHCLFRDYSEILLLETGVDKPKDMDFLLSVIKPDIAIITNIAPVHMAEGQFKDLQQIFDEKKKLVENLRENGVAILNIDNPFLAHLAKGRGKKVTRTFGKDKDADFFASRIEQSINGLSFILHNENKRYEIKTPVLGEHNIYVLMPAIICARLMGMEMEAAILALDRFSLPPGRMTAIPGKNNSIILDSSYNSSPEALKEALKILKASAGERRKIAVLGNMNELGAESEMFHKMIGELVPSFVDVLLTVGADAKFFAEEAEKKGMKKENIHMFKTSPDAAEFFQDKVKDGDVILVKGSQNRVRLEKFVKAVMANPLDADRLLVRQEKVWDKIGN